MQRVQAPGRPPPLSVSRFSTAPSGHTDSLFDARYTGLTFTAISRPEAASVPDMETYGWLRSLGWPSTTDKPANVGLTAMLKTAIPAWKMDKMGPTNEMLSSFVLAPVGFE